MSGSRDLNFSFYRTAELSVVGLELLMEPSDLAFTSLSLVAVVAVFCVSGPMFVTDACPGAAWGSDMVR